jgi:hypothetical protein
MAKFTIVSQEKHTVEVRDEAAGRTFTAALGPVQRHQVLAGVQDDPACNTNDISIALAISRLVNGKSGFAVAKQETIAKMSGIDESTVRRHLRYLCKAGGHIAQFRKGPSASAYFLVLQEQAKTTVHAVVRTGKSNPKNRQIEPQEQANDPSAYISTQLSNSANELSASGPSAARSGASVVYPTARGSSRRIPESPAGALSPLTGRAPAGSECENFPSLERPKTDHADDPEFHDWGAAAGSEPDDDAPEDVPRHRHSVSDDLDVDHPF